MTEAVLVYKLRAAAEVLRTAKVPVIVLDLDAFVLRRGCFDEWLAQPASIVMQLGGAPGCPPGWPFTSLGVGFNTGAMLLRPAALPFVRALLRMREPGWSEFPYQSHCYEQELFTIGVLAYNPRWRQFPAELALTGTPNTAMVGASDRIRLATYYLQQEVHGTSANRPRARPPHTVISHTVNPKLLQAKSWAPGAESLQIPPLTLQLLNYSRWSGGRGILTLRRDSPAWYPHPTPDDPSWRTLSSWRAVDAGTLRLPANATDATYRFHPIGNWTLRFKRPQRRTEISVGPSIHEGCLVHAAGLNAGEKRSMLETLGLWK